MDNLDAIFQGLGLIVALIALGVQLFEYRRPRKNKDKIKYLPPPANTGENNQSNYTPERSWRPWGDHPIFIFLSLIASIIGIAGAVVAILSFIQK